MQSQISSQKRNVVNQAQKILCTGCGTCAGVCPTGAIKMAVKDAVYAPAVAEDTCNNCGICIASCPQSHSDGEQSDGLSKENSGALLGAFSETYLAHAQDHTIRYGAASGGVVTALLIYALEKEIITGALVTRMNKDRPFEPEPFIARTREEIIEAARSKYCPVPANIALREILNSPDGERFAVVGSPCHIRGIRRAEQISERLKNKIVLHLGLFCSHTHTFAGTQFLLRSLDLKEAEIAEIFYRGFGWPGKTKIVLKDGTEKVFDHGSTAWGRLYNSFFFTPTSCMFCRDVTSEEADISLGDPWLPEVMAKERQGRSVLIARSAQAEGLLGRDDLKESIQLSSLSGADVVRSQRLFLHFKKINLAYRIRLARFFGLAPPRSIENPGRASVLNILVAWLSLFNNRYGSKFVALTRLYAPIVNMWVHLFDLVRSSAMERDFRHLAQTDPGYNIVILNAAWNNRGDEAAFGPCLTRFCQKFE